MPGSSILTGVCPECGAREVYTDYNVREHVRRSKSPFPNGMGFVATYVCLACGHFEEKLKRDDLAQNVAEIRAKWQKV